MWVKHLRQYGAFLTSSCSDRSTCAGGGAHRTIGSCELHSSACSLRCASSRGGVITVYAVLAPVAELSLQRLRASAPVVEYIAPAPAVVAALRCAGEPLEDHSPTQASFKTQSRNSGASLTVMTRMSRHSVVAPILAAPLLTDTRRLTVGPGTREDLVAATAPVVVYFVPVCSITSPAPLVFQDLYIIASVLAMDIAHVESRHASLRRFWSAALSTPTWIG